MEQEFHDEDKERHSSWLENFYDLIVAIVVSQLAVGLNQDISISSYITFVILFIPVWWSWLGVTFYNTRFETDDLGHRLLTLLQMAAAAFMAVNVIDGLGNNSSGFAISYAAIRTILVIEYLRTGKRIPAARSLTNLYSKAFLISASIWFVSAFVPPPIRFVLWIVGLAIDISTTLVFTRRLSKRFAPHIYHLPDRFGTFAIIVLGISILAFVDDIATHNWSFPSILSAALSLSIAFCIWWIYFDSVDGAAIRAFRRDRRRLGIYLAWVYIHFPLLIGITGFGVSIEHIVLGNQSSSLLVSDKWLMCGSVSLCLFSLAIIRITSIKSKSKASITDYSGERNLSIYGLGASAFILLFGVAVPEPLPLFFILVIAITFAGQVILDIKRHPHHRFFKLGFDT